MLKLQIKTTHGWQEVRDFRKKDRPIIFFDSEDEARRWRMKNLGIGSKNYTRIIDTDNRTVT